MSLSILTYTNGSDLLGDRYKLSLESFPEASVSPIQISQLVHMKIHPPKSPKLESWIPFFLGCRAQHLEVGNESLPSGSGTVTSSQGTRRRQQIPKPRPIGSCNLKSWGWWCLLGVSMISMICFSTLEDFVDGFLGRSFLQRATTGWRDQLATEKQTPNKTFSIVKVPLVPLTSTHPNKNLQSPMPPSHPVTSTAWHMEGPWVVGCCLWDPLFTENVSYPGSQMGIPKFVTSTKDQVSRKLFRRLPEHRNLVHTHRLSRFGASPMKNSPGCFWHSIVSSLQTGWLLHSSQHLPVLFGNINCPSLQWSVKHMALHRSRSFVTHDMCSGRKNLHHA